MKKNIEIEELSLREIQLIILEILKEIDKICKEIKIDYWMTAGTLLGARRHKGFIPWDDDIDIGMTREEFERFKKIILNYLPNYYKIQINEKNNGKLSEAPLIKIIDTRYSIEGVNPDDKFLFVDISPYDLFSKNKCIKLVQKLPKYVKKFKVKSYKAIVTGKSFSEKIYICISKLFYLIPEKYIEIFLKKWMKILNRPGKDTVFSHSNEVPFEGELTLEELYPLKRIKFETEEFLAPQNYENYLKKKYGNYMNIPLESKRHTHIKKAVKKGKIYV